MSEQVNHPQHYTEHPSGIECIEITQYMDFCRGNAFKYLWRSGLKLNKLEDLKKSLWYINRYILVHNDICCAYDNLHDVNLLCKIFKVIRHESSPTKSEALMHIYFSNMKEAKMIVEGLISSEEINVRK